MVELDDRLRVMNRLLDELVESLQPAGFESNGARIARTDALGAYIEAEARNPATGRQITLSYLPPGPSHSDVLQFLIEAGNVDSITVEEFVTHVLKDPERTVQFKLSPGREEDLESRAQAAFHAFLLLAHNELADTLAGRTWTHIPINMDAYR